MANFTYGDFSTLRTLHESAKQKAVDLTEKRDELARYEQRAAHANAELAAAMVRLAESCAEIAAVMPSPTPAPTPAPARDAGPRAIRLSDVVEAVEAPPTPSTAQ